MPETQNELDRRLTARGAATRARIVAAADELMSLKGAAATTLDEVTAGSGTSKSQFYRHFSDKSALMQAVIALRGSRVMEREEQYLRRVDSLRGLDRWRRVVIQRVTVRRGALGCELGSLSTELSDRDEDARVDRDAKAMELRPPDHVLDGQSGDALLDHAGELGLVTSSRDQEVGLVLGEDTAGGAERGDDAGGAEK